MIHKGVLVLGIFAGAGIGMLLAPDKGSTTRDNLNKGAMDIKDQLVDDIKEVREDLSKAANSGKDTAKAKLKNFASKASCKTETVLTYLEKQLAILKEKNKSFQHTS